MAKILITGAGGFIGRHLVKKVKTLGHETIEVTRQYGDITEKGTWEKLPSAEVVIHLAAKSFVPDSWTDIAGFVQCNVSGTIEALNYCKLQGAHLIYLSSYLYGNPQFLPIPETAELTVNNPYALTKKMAEEMCQFYSESFGVAVTILRPFNVYGLGQSPQFLIPSLINQAISQPEIRVKDLDPRRDYLYVNDLIQAIIQSIDYKEKFDIFNIGSGNSYSVRELIKIIQNHAKTDLPVVSDSERRRNEIMDTVADISKAQKKLFWKPLWSLSEGIQDVLTNAL